MCEERDNHQLDKDLLTNRLRHLEGEVEASKNSHNEKTREIRILEVRYVHLLGSWFMVESFGRTNHDYRSLSCLF